MKDSDDKLTPSVGWFRDARSAFDDHRWSVYPRMVVDQEADMAYLYVKREAHHKTLSINDHITIDLNSRNQIIGIEIFDYSSFDESAIRRMLKDCGIDGDILNAPA